MSQPVYRQRLLRGVLRLEGRHVTMNRIASLGARGALGVGAWRACEAAQHVALTPASSCGERVVAEVTWAGLRWLVHEYPHSIDGGPASRWSPTTLVTLGDTTAELGDWCQALGACEKRVTRDLRRGWTVLEALAQVGPSDCTRTGRTVAEEVAAFREHHPHGATLAEVGAWFGVTRERIRQIEVQALETLRGRLGSDVVTELAEALAQRTTWEEQWA